MVELKPCPFCSGKAIFLKESDGTCKSGQSINLGVVACIKLCCEQHYVSSEKEAIEAWNRRHKPTTEIDFDYAAEDI